MKKKSVFIIDDDVNLQKLLRIALEKNNYLVFENQTGKGVLDFLNQYSINIIILDLMLPDVDGLEILRQIRNNINHQNIPIIILSSKDSELDTVLGLEMGADDYIVKPVRYRELLARIKTVFRRTDSLIKPAYETITLENLVIIPTTRTVLKDNQTLKLTYIEFELLLLLANNPEKVFSRNDLLERIWSNQLNIETRTVDVHIQRLRKKVFYNTSSYIESVRSVGYCLHL